MPLRGPCVHPRGAPLDPAWKSWAPMRSSCVESMGTPAQCGAAAAGSGHGSPPGGRVDIPVQPEPMGLMPAGSTGRDVQPGARVEVLC